MQSETANLIQFGCEIWKVIDEMTISLEEAWGLEHRSGSNREEPFWLIFLIIPFLDCSNTLSVVSENICPLLDFSTHLGFNYVVSMSGQQNIVQYATYVLVHYVFSDKKTQLIICKKPLMWSKQWNEMTAAKPNKTAYVTRILDIMQ